jgi:ATP-dependent HslUV protease subunit HslV
LISGTGDVIEPEHGLIAIGSGGPFAQAAAMALIKHSELNAEEITRQALGIAADICIYTNSNLTIETLNIT